MDICTLTMEFNGSKELDEVATVWVFNGDGRVVLNRTQPLSEENGWTRVAGPLPYIAAHEIHGALKAFFLRSGVEVIDVGIDD
jgi:hypothetical protein